MREKKCQFCTRKFIPEKVQSEVCCSISCALSLANKKVMDIEIEKIKQKLETKSSYFKTLSRYFNAYIKLRDKHLPCISCGNTRNVRYDAGHFYPAGIYAAIRFNEDNVHKQCSFNCNKQKHGNLHEYKKGLIAKIGIERVNQLERIRHAHLNLSIPQIKEKIEVYKSKIKNHKS